MARSRPAEEFFIFSPEAGDYILLESAQELAARTASMLDRPFRSAYRLCRWRFNAAENAVRACTSRVLS